MLAMFVEPMDSPCNSTCGRLSIHILRLKQRGRVGKFGVIYLKTHNTYFCWLRIIAQITLFNFEPNNLDMWWEPRFPFYINWLQSVYVMECVLSVLFHGKDSHIKKQVFYIFCLITTFIFSICIYFKLTNICIFTKLIMSKPYS